MAASLLHVTGISPALSSGMAETILGAIRIAKDAGVTVSFDLNFRGSLWSRDAAREAYLRIIPQADLVFAGDDEAAIAVGAADTPLELAHRLIELGAGQAIVKLGARGAVAVVDGAEYERAAIPVDRHRHRRRRGRVSSPATWPSTWPARMCRPG